MVVEDNVLDLRFLSDILIRAGYRVRPTGDGELALRSVCAKRPDLILLDILLPGTSGIEVCRRLKADPGAADIPVVFISARESVDVKVEAFEAGAVDYLTKPIESSEVLVRIDTHLALNRLRRRLAAQTEELTAQMEHRRKAEEESIRLGRILEDSLNEIYVFDIDTLRFIEVNLGARRNLGYSTDELRGMTPIDVQPEFSVETFMALVEPLRTEERELIRYPSANRRKDDSRYPVDVHLQMIRGDREAVFVAIVLDITEQKRVEIDLAHGRKLEAVGQLAAGIAHEINTPTQFVSDNTRFLDESFGDIWRLLGVHDRIADAARESGISPGLLRELDALREEVDVAFLKDEVPPAIRQSVDGLARIATIVRAMKEFAHPDQIEKRPADLNQALLATLTIARNEYKYVAELETDLGDLPPVVCHVGDLKQMFLNLIVNAAHAIGDAAGDSGDKGTIRVRSAHDGDTVRIEIEDTGGGIPEAVRDRVFEPFFSTKEVGKGSGQGLAIARSIVVDKHGGSLTLDTVEGKGTRFVVRLPVGERDEPMGVA